MSCYQAIYAIKQHDKSKKVNKAWEQCMDCLYFNDDTCPHVTILIQMDVGMLEKMNLESEQVSKAVTMVKIENQKQLKCLKYRSIGDVKQ